MSEKSSGAVIFNRKGNETRFLLLHYNSGHWDFVKGHVEENETEEETLWREIEEETGNPKGQFRLIPGFRERITYFYKREGETIFKEVVLFFAEAKTDSVTLSSEHTDFAWLAFDQALKKITFPNSKQVLKKARDFSRQKNI